MKDIRTKSLLFYRFQGTFFYLRIQMHLESLQLNYYCYYYYYSLMSFSHNSLLVVFHWSFSDINFPQVSRTHLSILADLSNTVVLKFSILLLISSSSSPFSKLPRIVLIAPTTIGITLTLIFHGFFSSQARSKYLSIVSFFFIFTQWSVRMAKSTRWQILFFFVN